MPLAEAMVGESHIVKKLRSYSGQSKSKISVNDAVATGGVSMQVEHEDVWDGPPLSQGDDDDNADCNFLGFQFNGCSNGLQEGFRKRQKRAVRNKRRRRNVRNNTPEEQQKSNEPNTNFSSQRKKPKKQWNYTDRSPAKRGSNGWEECLRSRPAQVQHYQSIIIGKKMLNECKGKLNSSPTKRLKSIISSSDSETSRDSQDIMEMKVGDIVWAKLGCVRWWPAIVVCGDDCGQMPSRAGQAWVFWFGDHKISEVPNEKLSHFTTTFNSRYTDNMGKVYTRSVKEALVECAARANKDHPGNDYSFLLAWAKDGFPTDSNVDDVFSPKPDNPIPPPVRKILDKIKALNLAYQITDEIPSSEVKSSCDESKLQKGGAILKVLDKTCKIEDVCIACDIIGVEIICQHPLFHGGLCKRCRDNTIQTMFAYGDDGTNAFCVICANPGQLAICDIAECSRVYCTVCIETLVGFGARCKVLETNPWMCYMCTDYNKIRNGLIRRKDDWQQNVMKLFQPEKHIQMPVDVVDNTEKRPVRVLSLFDGIGTGKYVLDLLGIEVESYFASEIDMDAISVTSFHHGDSVTKIGCVEGLSDVEIAALCPVDLVIGGSPCNDLSLVNHARKGLYDHTGTGKLFFDFYRILKAVQLANKNRHVFWLYENVAAMPNEYKDTISRFLQCEPSMIDSKYFSAQNRARYFWGNIPGMYSPLPPHINPNNFRLESVLVRNCNRKALVDKVRTVTTRSNSLLQKKDCEYPVIMDGNKGVLWLIELERIFNFPDHYTDVGNLSPRKRQTLLGRAWTVSVIKYIFTPLRNFFKTFPVQSLLGSQTTTSASQSLSSASTSPSSTA